jgi:membrane carboxypeptidase/penicillin-binding protein PbpC
MTLVKKQLHHLFASVKKLGEHAFDSRHRKQTLKIIGAGIVLLVFLLYLTNRSLLKEYVRLESPALEDRNGMVMTLEANSKGTYGRYAATFPPQVKTLLIEKEDRFFYWHPGINPVSIARAIAERLIGQPAGGASTITQQLAKNLLGNEQDRSLWNKIVETWGAFSLELFNSKESILTMYGNSVYMGNQVQGLTAASDLYFGKKLDELDDTKIAMLLATISSPSTENPWRADNARTSRNLAARLELAYDPKLAVVTERHDYSPPQNFELASLGETCATTCTTTLDEDLTEKLRAILYTHVEEAWDSGARSGAIVVVKEPENEILAMVGTPDTHSFTDGQQINMTLEPRPIGSTSKPFIYVQGFTKGLRPYTLVDDREYKFPIGSGFSLYPKNYDGMYHGWVTLHSALSNSLNVPTVKVLEFVGLPDFYRFLQESLGFEPLRDLDDYQYGIALGALDMDPLTLAQYLTIFPKEGTLSPLKLFLTGTTTPYFKTPMSTVTSDKKVADSAMTELVTEVLHDRLAGVEQFGLKSSLNLPQGNYAVKTGTSQNYHDSWTVGYTPDFLVVVWFGNPDNSPLRHVTGQMGAGAIWHDAMALLMNSTYNKKTPFDFSKVGDVSINGSVDFGIPGETIADHQHLLPDTALIVSPKDGDTLLFEPTTAVPLISPENVTWYANGFLVGSGEHVTFHPESSGDYVIEARSGTGARERITVHLTLQQ